VKVNFHPGTSLKRGTCSVHILTGSSNSTGSWDNPAFYFWLKGFEKTFQQFNSLRSAPFTSFSLLKNLTVKTRSIGRREGASPLTSLLLSGDV